MALRLNWLNVLIANLLIFNLSTTAFALTDKDKVTFSTKKIQIGGKKITVEIAENPNQQERGLMFRTKLPQDAGMLFIFKKEETLRFWMKNTLINLSIAYINKDKKIIDIQEMKATNSLQLDIPNYPSLAPAMYALEMNANWFKKNKVKLGDKLIFIDKK